MNEKPVRKHQTVDLTVEEVGFGGKGFARLDNFVVFIGGKTVPGQRLRCRIRKVRATFAEAVVLEVLEKSAREIQAPCPYFPHCGGCQHQNISYDWQLQIKQRQVADLYTHLGNMDIPLLEPILGSETTFHYRNKMEFAFSNQRWLMEGIDEEKPRDFALGLRARGNYWKAIDIDNCLIAPAESAAILQAVRQFALDNRLSAYDQKKHSGFLRHLVVRKSHRTGNVMVNIVTDTYEKGIFANLVNTLRDRVPALLSVVNTVTSSWSGTTSGDSHLLWGEDALVEGLGDSEYLVSPASFFQTNTEMAERMYCAVWNLAAIEAEDIVWDLYCGTGSIAIHLARSAQAVYGFEIVPQAVADARRNAQRNGIENVRFIEGNLDHLFRKKPELLADIPAPDLVILDPPRGGLHPKTLADVIQFAPDRIVYVSCNPATQVRDLKILIETGNYAIDRIQPLDLFPHTPHIEVVTALQRR